MMMTPNRLTMMKYLRSHKKTEQKENEAIIM